MDGGGRGQKSQTRRLRFFEFSARRPPDCFDGSPLLQVHDN